ncbi:MAG: cytochrome c [Gammaproteobacteria bacterium]|jgi:mono/diheme cytochrome c family protein|nr:cytochrome c [Gammaproteobacteria bacterium]MBT3722698.1 cytochrome c [Gammaproteobacteria bacterium]MBT4078974.1 cytochrome c [Gammaproteobacteria bacterium]MBT4194701.1 cytochrome c [Gammaproteobacteria bacterium]MBT4450767.1 cytochrome c [Gammaproteobacteria bacterium]
MLNPLIIRIVFLFIFVKINFASANTDVEPLKRGEYLFNLGGCASCHSVENGNPLAGGLAMATNFGTFYTPNISPDRSTGIGSWDDEGFIQAMTKGESPDGQHYYPSFPYTSYSKMTRQDLIDLKHYIDTQPAFSQINKPHNLEFPFNIRPLLIFWKLFNFNQSTYQVNTGKSDQWNRGAYIVNGPGHCVECHTPRNLIGGLDTGQLLAGNPDGPEGESVPGLTKDKGNRISQWTSEDIQFSLQLGMIPDGDFLGGSMGHVIENTTSRLSENDLRAITVYLNDIKG